MSGIVSEVLSDAPAVIGAAISEAPAVVQSVEEVAAMGGQPTNLESRMAGLEGLVTELLAFLGAIHPPGSTPVPVPIAPVAKS